MTISLESQNIADFIIRTVTTYNMTIEIVKQKYNRT